MTWSFAIEREETTGKNKLNELMPNLDVFQPKKHIQHIKVNLVFPLSIAKTPYYLLRIFAYYILGLKTIYF